ncbi:MAG: DUF368 domain-containing protein [Bacteroidales bacterium]
MNRNIKDYLLLVLKGMGMGAADVVPGVSGGTIAFLVGIYEELINSIKSVNAHTLKLFFTFKWKEFWQAVNGSFLISVIMGIAISFMSLAKVITYLLTNHPVLVWAFFFGLVLASTWFVSKRIKKWAVAPVLSFVIGAVLAFFITMATPAETPDSYWFIFLCGSIAICAMILPGISGSFILVLLGKYFFMMEAIQNFKLSYIVTFISGAGIGIVLFSNVLSFLLRRFHDLTIALLTGFMFGSLNKVWPWKEVVETYIDRHGVTKPLIEANIAPNEYIWQSILLMLAGFGLVAVLEVVSSKFENKHEN